MSLAGIKLKDQVGPRVAHQQLTVVIHGHFREMPGSMSRGDHIGDELIGQGASSGLQHADSLIGIEPCILPAVSEIDEIRDAFELRPLTSLIRFPPA